MNTQNSIQILQAYATGLAAQSIPGRRGGYVRMDAQLKLIDCIGVQNWLIQQL